MKLFTINKNKSKIVIVCNSTNPDLVNYFKCQIKAIINLNLNHNMIALINYKIKLPKNCQYFYSSFTKKAFLDRYFWLDLIKNFIIFIILLKNNIKLIHFTTAHLSNLFLGVLLRPFKIKQIYTIHDLEPHPGIKSFFINLYNKFVIYFLADEVITFSYKYINTQPQKQKNKFKFFILSGFPQRFSKPKYGNKTILFFGRIEPYKGLDNLFNLIKISNKENINYTFLIAGKGKIKDIKKFLEFKNVKIINKFISDNEMEYLFKEATFTILPYNQATQSGVIILSYSFATPVIAYNVGALYEYIENNRTGLLVDYKDNYSIIDFLKKVKKEEILEMSENIIKIFQYRYSEENCVKQYLNYYKNLYKER